jgi:hypothetical protein
VPFGSEGPLRKTDWAAVVREKVGG